LDVVVGLLLLIACGTYQQKIAETSTSGNGMLGYETPQSLLCFWGFVRGGMRGPVLSP